MTKDSEDWERRGLSGRATRIVCILAIVAAAPLCGSKASGVVREGLVLWLDATDASTITLDEFGRITSWSDKSPSRCQASAAIN